MIELRRRLHSAAPLLLLAAASCGEPGEGPPSSRGAGEACRVIQRSIPLPEGLGEASGVAWSVRYPGAFWSHNDSGGDPEIFLITPDGKPGGPIPLPGARLRDWEDMAVAPCAEGSCVVVGDIGDNRGRQSSIRLYVASEPARGGGGGAREYSATYPDGRGRDAEALFILPDGRIYLVTKGAGGPVELFRWPTPLRDEAAVLELVRVLAPEPRQPGDRITGASASPDGRHVALRSYGGLAIYRTEALLAGAAPVVTADLTAVAEAQGEGVALDNDGRIVLVSESGSRHFPGSAALLTCSIPADPSQPIGPSAGAGPAPR